MTAAVIPTAQYLRRNHFENRAFDEMMLVVCERFKVAHAKHYRPSRVKVAGGMAPRTESRTKRVPTLMDRFSRCYHQGRMEIR